jgi:hypothetical protein
MRKLFVIVFFIFSCFTIKAQTEEYTHSLDIINDTLIVISHQYIQGDLSTFEYLFLNPYNKKVYYKLNPNQINN